MKANIEIELKPGTDASKVQDRLRRYRHLKAYQVTCSRLRIWYSSSHLTLKKVMQIVKSASQEKKTKIENL